MRIKIPLLAALFATLSLSLSSCDTDALVNSASEGTSLPGGVSFGLDAQVIATVHSTVDSLRLELRQGTVVRTQAVVLDSSVRVSDLAAGRWFIGVGLYNKQGVLKYYGSDSVTVVAGEVAKADIGLSSAKGSVDVSIHLDSATMDTTLVSGGSSKAFLGNWLLHLPDTLVRQMVPEPAVDTLSLKLATVSILALQKQDSFLVLTVKLPHPSVKVRLLDFTYVDEICIHPGIVNDTLPGGVSLDTGCSLVYAEYLVEPPQRLLVIGEESDSTADAQGPVVAKLRIPRSSLTRTKNVSFTDRTGKQAFLPN